MNDKKLSINLNNRNDNFSRIAFSQIAIKMNKWTENLFLQHTMNNHIAKHDKEYKNKES